MTREPYLLAGTRFARVCAWFGDYHICVVVDENLPDDECIEVLEARMKRYRGRSAD